MIKKSYMRTIMEDLAPYLAQVEQTDKDSRYNITYIFNIQKLSGNERLYTFRIFNNLATKQNNWKRTGSHVFEWETDSVQLQNWFLDRHIKKEPINDIPIDNPVFKQDEFKQTENKVNKDKFSAENKTYIRVNGKDFCLVSPFKPESSLEVVLELTERLNVLTNKIGQLNTINNSEDQTDRIAFDKVLVVATDEISDIKEMIDFINDNIE